MRKTSLQAILGNTGAAMAASASEGALPQPGLEAAIPGKCKTLNTSSGGLTASNVTAAARESLNEPLLGPGMRAAARREQARDGRSRSGGSFRGRENISGFLF